MISTTTLETSKLLRDAGFKQFGIGFAWAKVYRATGWIDEIVKNNFQADIEFIAAPTSDELLEELPASIERDKCTCTITITKWNRENQWRIAYCGGEWEDEDKVSFQADTLPEALAAMWLWLKKEGLL